MSMVPFPRGGHNPVHGRDTGPAPPSTRQFMPGVIYPFTSEYAPSGQNSSYPSGVAYYFIIGSPSGVPSSMSMALRQNQALLSNHMQTSPRIPRALPAILPEMPAANMTNSTGGVGCEPGYNYFFPPEHTKIIVMESQTAPWRLPANATFPTIACHISTKTTIAELMAGSGATHPERDKNSVTEVIQKGNGGWIKGLSFCGSQKKELKQTMAEVGWDKTRTGLPGQKPVIYLFFTRG